MRTQILLSPNDHYMKSYLGPEGDVHMIWPKNLPLKRLDYMLESVTFQINVFRESAKVESDKETAARLEYESWITHTHAPAI